MLTTRASVKTQGGIAATNTDYDAQFDSLIAGITDLVKRELNRDIEGETLTEYYSGDNSRVLILRQYPVISVSSVIQDDYGYFGQGANAFQNGTELVAGTDYALMSGQKGVGSSGKLLRIGGVWYGRPMRLEGWVANQPPVPQGNYKIVYTAGFRAIPKSIEMAVNAAVLRAQLTAAAGGAVTAASYEDASVQFADPDAMAKVFASIENALGHFKRYPV